ncbi:ATP-NAD kinase [Epithele typhae]|uniref:ATP-NAD kinase n=1 Tax=Epithele typhae TaxID=378194 RepID=UPI002007A50C|nr:ATP-NAD kinase [Epithele typhae]KAH9929629.1 ATP-NAD kinase [Epithele typhae]
MHSPDNETFSTPPSTPSMPDSIRPSISRRTSRPSQLHIMQNSSDCSVVVEQQSPEISARLQSGTPTGTMVNGKTDRHVATIQGPQATSNTPTITHHSVPSPVQPQRRAPSPAIKSPCFLHSKLQSNSLMDWLGSVYDDKSSNGSREKEKAEHTYPDGTVSDYSYSDTLSPYDDEEREYGPSLTKKLAETAISVREVSKKLGRTRVQSNIQSVLIVTKARDNRLIKLTRELALYLMMKRRGGERGMIVYVDNQLKTSRRFDAAGMQRDHPELFVPFPKRRTSSTSSLLSAQSTTNGDSSFSQEGQLRYWTADMCNRSPHLFDFVVTLGGDGTVLFTSWLFQRIVPPVLPFALGSLGFLTNFDFADHRKVMDSAIDNGIRVNLRMRFTCTVYRAIAPEKNSKACRAIKKGGTGEILMRGIEESGWEALESGGICGKAGEKDKEIMCFSTRPVECFEILNDLVVDRGPSPYVSLLELFGDEHHLTTVQADGLCVATPTGSTAYSLSAGGSLVHPEIPAILITPLCPHTLSFRPMLLPDTMELRICVPFNSRSTAWASFDGRGRVELKQGDHIKVTASQYPFPTVCAESQSRDWFHSISRTLKWNERERQKSFVVVEEEGTGRKRRSTVTKEHDGPTPTVAKHATPKPNSKVEEDEEDECSDEDEEKFDIDDLSSAESPTTSDKNKHSPKEETRGQTNLRQEEENREQERAHNAAVSLARGNPDLSSTPSSGLKSGIDSPDRFAGSHPHPPRISPRHVQFVASSASSSSSSIDQQSQSTVNGERGERDDIRGPRSAHFSSKVRIPRDRDVEGESLKTPTPVDPSRMPFSRSRSRSRSRDPPRRAFAVWGHDESDSAASDSDADA